MREVSGIAVDHVVIQSSRSYEAVKTALEQRLGTLGWQLATKRASWDEIVRTIELQLGPCGFSIFGKVERGQLLSLAGKRGKTVRYAIGLPEGSHGPYDKRAENLRRAI
jgi:hypothetical protein